MAKMAMCGNPPRGNPGFRQRERERESRKKYLKKTLYAKAPVSNAFRSPAAACTT